MPSAAVTLKYLLLGDASSASAAMKKVGGEADQTGGKFHGMATKTNVALLAVTGSAVAFGKKSIDTFKEVGGETLTLQRLIGGTAEQSSRLVFAAQESGVGFETLSKSTGKLEKALAATTGNAKANAAMVQTLGFNYRDAHGQILPMGDLLPKLADKFSKMPAGAEKTALAMKLFGKSGADLLPFLNKGKTGIQDLQKESDKFGTTLTGKNLDALKQAKAGQREWQASLQGLQIQIGAQLLPIMNTLVGFIRDHVIPVVVAITGFIREHKTAVMIAVTAIGAIVLALKAWAVVQAIMNVLMATNPIVLIITALIALAAAIYIAYHRSATFREIVQTAFQVIKQIVSDVWNVLKVIFQLWVDQIRIVAGVVMWLWHNVIEPAFGGIKAYIQLQWTIIKGVFNAFVTVGKTIGDGLMWAWSNVIHPVIGWIHDAISWISGVVKSAVGVISGIFGHLADGLAWVYYNVIDPIFTWIENRVQDVINALKTVGNAASYLDPASNKGGTTKRVVEGVLTGGASEVLRAFGLASGGPATPGVPYIVGENRPEVFVPDTAGRVIANPRFSSGGGSSVVVSVQISALDAQSFQNDPGWQRSLIGTLERALGSGMAIRGLTT